MKDDDYWSISDDSSSLVRTAPDDCCSISSVTASSYDEETLVAGSSRSAKIGISLLFASALGLFAVSSIRQTSSTEELSSLMATTVTEHGRQLQDDNDSNTPLVYSKMATIVPDPTHPISDKAKKEAKEKFGAWGFWDGDESMRPTDDYCAKAPNRDVVEFPDTAWQNDAVFVNHYLNDAEQLVGRTMEAIFTEYGWGIDQWPADQKAWVMKERLKMYHVEYVEDEDFAKDDFTAPEKYLKRGTHGSGGWSTKRSFDGLVRRLLHAMTTNDEFVVVLGK